MIHDDLGDEEYDPHPFEMVEVKPGVLVEIDVEMVPLVKWLNSFPDVTTLFCCQGDDDDEGDGQPYLMLTCADYTLLGRISRFLGGDTRGEFDASFGEMRFTFRWWRKDKLRNTLRRLEDLPSLSP